YWKEEFFMYNIYDILEEIDFNLVNKELEFVKVYVSNRVVHLNFYIKHNGEVIFDYILKYYAIYNGNFNEDAVKATEKDILNDLDREIKEQTGIKYIISNAEKEWKDSYGI